MYPVPSQITVRVRLGFLSWPNLMPWPNKRCLANRRGQRRTLHVAEGHLRWWHLFTPTESNTSSSSPKERSTGTGIVMPPAPPTRGGSSNATGIGTWTPLSLRTSCKNFPRNGSEPGAVPEYWVLCPSTAHLPAYPNVERSVAIRFHYTYT